MQTLKQQADAIVANPRGAACVRLGRLPSWLAVLQFAQDSQLITPEQGTQFGQINWAEDFSAFVAPTDQLVTTAAALRLVPPGAFMAFIAVDPAPAGRATPGRPPMGKRHLVHAMLHLGEGWAAGTGNYRALGIGKGDGWEVLNLGESLHWVRCADGFDALNGVPLGVQKVRLLRIRCRSVRPGPAAFVQRFQSRQAEIMGAVAANAALGDGARDKFDVVADLITTPAQPLEALAIDDWNSVKARYATPATAFAMLLMQAYRKRLVDQKIRQHAEASAQGTGRRIISKSVGSSDMTSDYDITLGIVGGDVSGAELDAIERFNNDIRRSFGHQPGTVFDTNVYAKDFLALNADDLRLALPSKGAALYTMVVEGQDVGALLKQRRYMASDQWHTSLAQLLQRVGALNPMAEALARHRYESADAQYHLNLQALLAEFDRRATDPATFGTAYAAARADVDAAVTERALSQGDRLLLNQAKGRDLVLAQLLPRYKALYWEHRYPDLVLWASNDLYVSRMREIRRYQQQAGLARPGPAADVRVADLVSSAIFFAAEAYLSEGALRHVVDGVQAANAAPGLKPVEKAAAVRSALLGLTVDQLLQSVNEQFGDFLKDFAHYGDAPVFLFRGAKYVQRLLEALDVMVQMRQAVPGPAPGALEHLDLAAVGRRLGWRCADALVRLNQKGDGLVAVRKGDKVFASDAQRDDYCRGEARRYFGSDSGAAWAETISALVMLVNVQLRSGATSQPSDDDVQTYFRSIQA